MGSNGDMSKPIIIVSILLIFTLYILGGTIQEQAKKSNEYKESVRNQFVLVGKNDLGCTQYQYNQDTFWKCPKGLGVTEVGRKVCGVGKRSHICYDVFDPVIE